MEQINYKPKVETKHRNFNPEKPKKTMIVGKLDLLGKGANKDYGKIIFLKKPKYHLLKMYESFGI